MDYINEKKYLKKIGKTGIKHSLEKPFSDKNCGALLAEIGAIISLLPERHLKILDIGCGSGWTSTFFAKKGHQVLGIDISKDMIKNAKVNKKKDNLSNLNFKVENAERIKFNSEFDCVVFIDALHHCKNHEKVMKNAYDALKGGGICIISEPGLFHSKSPDSIKAVKEYGVLEKELSPKLTRKIGRQLGFRNIKTYPRAMYLNFALYTLNQNLPNFKIVRKLFKFSIIRILASIFLITFYKRCDGIVVMRK